MTARSIALRAAVTIAVATLGLTAPAHGAQAAEGRASARQPSYLFTVEAAHGTTAQLKPRGSVERMTITLDHVDPVTQFTDRPLRNARLISPSALTTHWATWFADSPPNAVMTWSDGADAAPASFVVTLTKAAYNPATRQLTFTAERDPRQHDPAEKGRNWKRLTTPAAFTQASLFIDNAGTTTLNGCTIASNASCPGANLSGLVLLQVGPLLNVNLAGASMTNANIAFSVFGSSTFTGVDFTGATLSNVIMDGSALDNITARSLNFSGSTFEYSTFTGATLSFANFQRVDAENADFSNANLGGVDFSFADLTNADFSGANLAGANFNGANVSGAKFYGANLNGANLPAPSWAVTNVNTICPNGVKGYCSPWTPQPGDLPSYAPPLPPHWNCDEGTKLNLSTGKWENYYVCPGA